MEYRKVDPDRQAATVGTARPPSVRPISALGRDPRRAPRERSIAGSACASAQTPGTDPPFG